MSIITGQLSQVEKLIHQTYVGRSDIYSVLLFLDLPEGELDLDQGVYLLVADLIRGDLTDIVLPGKKELIVVPTLLPHPLLTNSLIKVIIREDISLDLLLDILINILDLHLHLLILL